MQEPASPIHVKTEDVAHPVQKFITTVAVTKDIMEQTVNTDHLKVPNDPEAPNHCSLLSIFSGRGGV